MLPYALERNHYISHSVARDIEKYIEILKVKLEAIKEIDNDQEEPIIFLDRIMQLCSTRPDENGYNNHDHAVTAYLWLLKEDELLFKRACATVLLCDSSFFWANKLIQRIEHKRIK